MISITPTLAIDESEIHERFVRASGPGGQNVNKVATAVQLRFDAAHSPSLPDDVKRRLRAIAGARMTGEGEILIDAREHRSQEQNRAEALRRLVELIRQAARPPKKRRKTRPTRASQERRLQTKKQRGETKRLRSRRPRSEE